MRWLLFALVAGCSDDPCQPDVKSFEPCSSPGTHCQYPHNECLCSDGIWECRDGEGPPDLARRQPDLSTPDLSEAD